MDIDQLSEMIESELEMINNLNKGKTSYRKITQNVTKDLNKSFNQISMIRQVPTPPVQQYMRRTKSFHNKTLNNSIQNTQRTIKKQEQIKNIVGQVQTNPLNLSNRLSRSKLQTPSSQNQLAQGFTHYIPSQQCEQSQLTLDEYIDQNDLTDSLVSNYGHYAENIKTDKSRERYDKQSTQQKTIEDSQCSFRPMLLRKSLMMADKLGDPIERLNRKREQPNSIQEYSFQPSINKTPKYLKNSARTRDKMEDNSYNYSLQAISSSRLPNQDWDSMPRWKQLYEKGKYQREKLDLKREILSDNSLNSDNTFQPDISRSQNNYKEYQGQSDLSFVERHNCWEQLKKQKLAQRTQEAQTQVISQCSFKPALQKSRGQQSPNQVSEFGRKGWVEFFDRVGQAHQKKKNLQMDKQYGQNWKNKLTRPQEPKQMSRPRTYNSSKENHSINMNLQSSLAPQIQQLRQELQSWNY